MRRLSKTISFLAPLLVILITEIFLFNNNFVPDTWLIGWDSTQPELNFSAHLMRDFGAIWQEYRGLGVLDGMAHSANLVHLAYIYLISFFFPPNVIRYVFVILMHALGGLGVYFLANHLLKTKDKFAKSAISLVAAFFYLFNPGTIQIFYAPLELFIIHFGFLPWLILFLSRYLKTGEKKDLALFGLVNVLGLSQAHVPTIFIVYAISVFFFLFTHLLIRAKRGIKEIVSVVLIIFAINAFWGLPYIYSSIKNANVITSSKINVLSNHEIVLRNETYGDLKSTALLYGFNLDYEDWQTGTSDFDYQFKPWRDYWLDSAPEIVGIVVFSLSIVGILYILIKREKKFYPFIFIFLFAFINLASNVPIASGVRSILWKGIPYYEEIFRFAFTKFIIIYALSISILVAYSLEKILSLKVIKNTSFIVVLLFLTSIIWANYPAFNGNFLYDKLRLEVPEEYFDTFGFFSGEQNQGRVAILPQPSLWGWEFNRWGYRGSGFIWQGIANPLLHRSFDPWSMENESYYQELSKALYDQDLESFEKTLEKYKVSYILLDKNIFQPGGWPEALLEEEIDRLLSESPHISKVKEFENISIFKTDYVEGQNYLWTPKEYVYVANSLVYPRKDEIYFDNGDYLTWGGIYYPYTSLYSDRPFENIVKADALAFDGFEVMRDYNLNIPSWLSEEDYLPVDIYATYKGGKEVELKFVGLYPLISVNGLEVNEPFEETFTATLQEAGVEKLLLVLNGEDIFEVSLSENQYIGTSVLSLSKKASLNIYDSFPVSTLDLTDGFSLQEVRECWKREGQTPRVQKELIDHGIRLSSTDAAACIGMDFIADIAKSTGLMKMAMTYASSTGTPPDTCLIKIGDGGCIGDPAHFKYGPSRVEKPLFEYYELESGGKYFYDLTARGSDTPLEESQIEYRNINLEFFDLLGNVAVSIDETFTPRQLQISLKKGDEVSIEIPLGVNKGLVATEDLDKNRGGEDANNCDLFDRGSVSKVKEGDGVTYLATEKGVNCLYMVYPGFEKNVGYVLRFRGENLSGRSVKFFLNNNFTRRNDLEHKLGRGEFDESYIILPRTDENGKYDLTLEVRSFGSEVSKNHLEKIDLVPIPFNYLTSINLIPKEDVRFENDIQIIDSKKDSTTHYYASINAESDAIVALSQSYEDGWKAYFVNNDCVEEAGVRCVLSGLFGKPLEHTRLNSWENAWKTPTGKHQVVFVYTPIYYAYLGYAVFVVIFGGLIIKLIVDKRHSKRLKLP